MGEDYLRLLASFEVALPLEHLSGLVEPALALKILSLSEGTMARSQRYSAEPRSRRSNAEPSRLRSPRWSIVSTSPPPNDGVPPSEHIDPAERHHCALRRHHLETKLRCISDRTLGRATRRAASLVVGRSLLGFRPPGHDDVNRAGIGSDVQNFQTICAER
jgi:hypothetical protein